MHQKNQPVDESTRSQKLMIETNNKLIEELAASKKKTA